MQVDEERPGSIVSPKTLERISKAVQGTRNEVDLNHAVDQFVYAEKFQEDAYKLIEVTPDIADHVVQGGDFYMIGDPLDNLTFCTPGKTFQTREIERSNCMVVSDMKCPPQCTSDTPSQRISKVMATTYKSIDLSEKTLLNSEKFKALDRRGVNLFEDNPVFNQEKLSLKQFIHSIPLSIEQTKQKLKSYPIFELNNQLYQLDEDGRKELLLQLCDYVDEFSRSDVMNNFQRQDIASADFFIEIGRRFSLEVVESLTSWILFTFFEENKKKNPSDTATYSPNEVAFSREIAIMVLKEKAANRFILMTAFVTELSVRLPPGVRFEEECLKGISFVKTTPGGDRKIMYFNHADMPLDLDERLSVLFSMCPQWYVSDAEPYLQDFLGPDDTVLKLVSNRCRTAHVNGKDVLYPL
ncbi:unnamed protein product [Bursaphelenchus xylophilus]|uniref:Sister chromatid cohesion protein DCC1 n=1 Tax=Bursaphelenchus xylophilus TaxID=6326 RepID=A0A1I7S689_BURXY|nr:unnamed protein product [Bursaphelenchus xylophilus]CAG9128243.1 unnamed protein product [Bursaphelenchus xylophilus]